MSDEKAFLRALAADPGDHDTRRVFADWLEDRGDPRAAWVRSPAIFRWMGPNAADPIPALIDALLGDDYQKQQDAENVLIKIGVAAVPSLLAVIEEGSVAQCPRAGHVISRIEGGATSILPRLFDLLKDERDVVRLGAVHAITNAGPAAAPAVPVLHTFLTRSEDEDSELADAAMSALASIGPAAASVVPDLVHRLWDRDSSAGGVIGAIGPAGTQAVLDNLHRLDQDILPRAVWPLREHGPPAAPVLRAALKHESEKVRWVAALALEPCDPESALPILVEMLQERLLDESLGEMAAEAVENMGDAAAPAAPALQALLPRLSGEARSRILRALQGLGQEAGTVPLLLANLKDPHYHVRAEALGSLSQLGESPPEVLPAALDCLRDPEAYVRQVAIGLVAKLAPSHPDRAVAALRAALEDESSDVRTSALHVLQELQSGEERTLDLIRALQDPVESLRLKAAEALGKLDEVTPEVAAALRGALRDSDESVRRTAVDALGQLDPVRAGAVPDLMQLLRHDPAEYVRKAVVKIVRQFEFPAAETVTVLRGALADPHQYVRWEAMEQLGSVAKWDKSPDEAGAAIPDLLRLLDGGSPADKEHAARALAEIGPAAIPGLTERAHQVNEEVRRYALEGLARAGAASAPSVPDLTAQLADRNPQTREKAAEAIGNAGPAAEAAVSALRLLFYDEYPDVRAAAAGAIGKIGPAAAGVLSELRDLLRDENGRVRSHAIGALRQVGAPDAVIPYLRQLLKGADRDLRQLAAVQLGEYGPAAADAASAIVTALGKEEAARDDLVKVLGKLGAAARGVVPFLRRALEGGNHFRRYFVAVSLGQLGPAAGAKTAPVLAELALNDPDDQVRERVLWSLQELGPGAAAAVPPARKALTHADGSVRAAAADLLAALGAAAAVAVPDLIAALRDPDWGFWTEDRSAPDQRYRAAAALAAMGAAAAAAIPALCECYDAEDEDVRSSAVEALRELGPAGLAAVQDALNHPDEVVRDAAASALEPDEDEDEDT